VVAAGLSFRELGLHQCRLEKQGRDGLWVCGETAAHDAAGSILSLASRTSIARVALLADPTAARLTDGAVPPGGE
jgi:hypothetical protein